MITADVAFAGDLRLAVRRAGPTGPGARRPLLLVHGLASNARMWDGVAQQLAAEGHEIVAVDQRGHGLSPEPADGYDTATCADDLALLIEWLGWTGERRPVVAGQSWGGNVVLTLAARHPSSAAAIALVDGGWLRFGDRFADADSAWAVLAPPSFEGMRYDELARRMAQMHDDWPPEGIAGSLANLLELPGGGVRARLTREHHRSIVDSMWRGDPRTLYPLVDVPVLLMPAGRSVGSPAVREAAAQLRDSAVSEYVGAHHDLHAQHPVRCARDLEALAARADAAAEGAAR